MAVTIFCKETSFSRFALKNKDKKTVALLRAKSSVVSSLKKAHDEHNETLEFVQATLNALGISYVLLYKEEELAEYSTNPIMLTVGGDGTFLKASRHVSATQQIIGINSSPSTSVGFFCSGKGKKIKALLESVFEKKIKELRLERMQVQLNGKKIETRVLNEALFCHASPAATTRFELTLQKKNKKLHEDLKSSGLWVGPAAGSTAAIRSAGGRVLPLDSTFLQFVVREPYRPELFQKLTSNVDTKKAFQLNKGMIDKTDEISVLSKTRRARLYIDGTSALYPISLGDRLDFSLSDEPLFVLGLQKK